MMQWIRWLFLNARIAFASTLLGLLGCSAHSNARSSDHAIPHLFGYEDSRFTQLLRSNGLGGDVGWIRVNGDGTRLFIQEIKDGVDGAILSINFADGHAEKLRLPARTAWLSNDGTFAAWTNNSSQSVTFANGQTRKFDPIAYDLDVDNSGRFFVITFTKSGRTDICLTSDPSRPVVTLDDTDFWSSSIFTGEGRLYVLDEHLHDGTKPLAPKKCVIFTLRDGRYVRDRMIDLPGQMDYADPYSARVIVRDQQNPIPALRAKLVFDLKSGETMRLPSGRVWLFLKEDYLGDGMRIQRKSD